MDCYIAMIPLLKAIGHKFTPEHPHRAVQCMQLACKTYVGGCLLDAGPQVV